MDCHFVNYREITARYTAALARNIEAERRRRKREKEREIEGGRVRQSAAERDV